MSKLRYSEISTSSIWLVEKAQLILLKTTNLKTFSCPFNWRRKKHSHTHTQITSRITDKPLFRPQQPFFYTIFCRHVYLFLCFDFSRKKKQNHFVLHCLRLVINVFVLLSLMFKLSEHWTHTLWPPFIMLIASIHSQKSYNNKMKNKNQPINVLFFPIFYYFASLTNNYNH